MSAIWEIAADNKTLSAAFLIAKNWAKTNQNEDSIECTWCDEPTSDPFKHLVTSCPHNFVQRAAFRNFVKDNVSTEIGCLLQNSDFETFLCVLLGSCSNNSIDTKDSKYTYFLVTSFGFVSDVVRKYGIKF